MSKYFFTSLYYSLPSQELDGAALRAAPSNSWFLMSSFTNQNPNTPFPPKE